MLRERGSSDPAGVLALAGAGTIAAHELGYLVDPLTGGTSAQVSHAHLAVLGPLALFALCVAGWAAAVRVLRAGGGTPPSWRHLAALQTGAYLALEVGERAVAGDLESLASAPVALGLLLQPVIAWAAIRLLAVGRDVLVRVFGATDVRLPVVPLPSPVAPVIAVRSVWVAGRARPRGPPVC